MTRECYAIAGTRNVPISRVVTTGLNTFGSDPVLLLLGLK
jgi:hypothetical protein